MQNRVRGCSMHSHVTGCTAVVSWWIILGTSITFAADVQQPPSAIASHKAVEAFEAALAKDVGSGETLAGRDFAHVSLTKADADKARELLWKHHAEWIKEDRAAEIQAGVLKYEKHDMPFYLTTFGQEPKAGWSLWISMHGGGGAPKQVNDQQWENQKHLYKLDEGIYVAPRAPTDNWNLWHEAHIDPLFDRLIEDLIVLRHVDPNRVYIMGYSAGGDGVYQLAPRMADRWAAAAMMAGHPNDASWLGLRNIGFAIQAGGLDSAYNRNKVAQEWIDRLDQLHRDDPQGYVHFGKIFANKGHWMDREDAKVLPWMAAIKRNPLPDKVVWKQSTVVHDRFYWLAIPGGDSPQAGAEVVAERKGQTVEIKSAEKVGAISIRFDDRMADLDQAVRVVYHGKTLFDGPAHRTIATLLHTLDKRGDPDLMFDAEVAVKLPAEGEKLAKPTADQAAWQDGELGMFIHFGPATWQDVGEDNLSTPLNQINPDKLDTEQWVRAAEEMGAHYIVFVAKHSGGFCWWQTDTTDYSVKNTPWHGGKGDVLAELSASCKKHGMKLGVYLSPTDHKHQALGGGRCPTPELQAAYNKIYRQQLTEVLSRYGSMYEVWFDGSVVVPVGDILKEHAPHAMIFQGPHATIRWVGNEDGRAPYPAWNSLSEKDARSGVATAKAGNPDGSAWLPNECDAEYRDAWMWNSTNAKSLKSVGQLMKLYDESVGHGAVLLLNHSPDRSGLIPAADIERGKEFGDEIRREFGHSLAETAGHGELVELSLPKPTAIDRLILMEDITGGERVREYVVEGMRDGKWQPICDGTAIGHKRIQRFAPVEVSAVRLRVIRSAAEPQIRKLAVFSPLTSR